MHYNEKRRFIRHFVSAVYSALPAVFWILLIFSFDKVHLAIMTIIAAVIHEAGHVLYILFFIKKTVSIKYVLGGIKIKNTGGLSYKEETLLYIFGPFLNFLVAVVAFALGKIYGEYFVLFGAVNAITGLSNLLPIEGYDGWGAIRSALSCHLNPGTVHRILSPISFSVTVLLCFVALYIMGRLGESFWIFAVFTASMLSKISSALKNIKNEQNGDFERF